MKPNFDSIKQNQLAEKFHALHHTGNALLLPNVWDAVSAKIIEESGFPAIATSSAAIAWSLGYQDGENIPPELMLEAIQRITRAVKIPVSVDIEGGYYRHDLKKFAAYIAEIIEAGAVGINLEDSDANDGVLICDFNLQLKVIRLAKEVGRQKGVNLFVNARTDAYNIVFGDSKTKTKISIDRANAFQEAGADGVFIPFVREMDAIVQFKKEIKLPLNILMDAALDVKQLRQLNVNRISTGPKPILATLSALKNIAHQMNTSDNWEALFVKEVNYNEVNKWFIKKTDRPHSCACD
ncbi:MAG: isocitrate lyase/phosphoenolpyruvate mutase family protein [Chitinophagales bacterium]|nr:isocitrate lyase/phosphoenolpyruvate mutase family protein [Chitinophagales bacterium]